MTATSKTGNVVRVGLVSCGKKKRPTPSPAGKLYTSTLFKKSVEYLRTQGITHWYILSAKYGVLHPDLVIKPYEKTLKKMDRAERDAWSRTVVRQLDLIIKTTFKGKCVEFVCLASGRYKVPLQDGGYSVAFPWDGKSLYDRVSFHEWMGFKLPRVLKAAAALQYPPDTVQALFARAKVPFDRPAYLKLYKAKTWDRAAAEDVPVCAALTLAARKLPRQGLFGSGK
jgi:hypothetical protein